jgi:hypothetical protein
MQMATNFKIEVEQFNFLPTNRAYLISDKGRIYSKKSKRFLFGSVNKYIQVSIYDNTKAKTRRIHQLVMEAFVGPRPHKHDTNHIDGDKTNNCLENLEYCTRSQNNKHAYRLGLNKSIPPVVTGERHGNCKLTDLQVKEIRAEIKSPTMSRKDLAKKYSICESHISHIKHNPDYRKTI